MKRDDKMHKLFRSLLGYFAFFMMVAFVITCCMTLFLAVLSRTADIEFDEENLNLAAKITFLNVLFISLLLTLLDALRRHLKVTLPVNEITAAAERVMEGDYSAKIAPVSSFACDEKFLEIIDCFNKMTDELSGVETLRLDFIANVSHEMKTPLAAIQNYATLLEAPCLDEKTRLEYAGAVSAGAKRLSDMMTNILKLNKLESQRIYPEGKLYDLSEQLCECILGYEHVWESRDIEIETDIAEGVTVTADPELLSLIWNNLLSNAFKFTEKGGKVRIELSRDNEAATVSIIDTGCGIPKEVGEHIFEKFYQADSSRATQGNGLGLALVKRVVDIVSADVSVESTVGVGTRFTVRVPLSRRNENGKL